MSYIPITTRCNMACAHCCYSCRPGAGQHMDMHTFQEAVIWLEGYSEFVAIGGGEPTLHPRFFDILRRALWGFEFVWLATNGTRTAKMRRLHDILNDEDLENDDDDEPIYIANSLTVALSQDPWHDQSKVAAWVRNTWTRNAQRKRAGFEIRDASQSLEGPIATGRAKRTQVGAAQGCVCTSLFIDPQGDIKPCGCHDAPVIGNVRQGLTEEGEQFLQSEEYQETNCWKQ